MARPPTRSRRGLADATLPRGLAADTPPRARAVSREPYLELPRSVLLAGDGTRPEPGSVVRKCSGCVKSLFSRSNS